MTKEILIVLENEETEALFSSLNEIRIQMNHCIAYNALLFQHGGNREEVQKLAFFQKQALNALAFILEKANAIINESKDIATATQTNCGNPGGGERSH